MGTGSAVGITVEEDVPCLVPSSAPLLSFARTCASGGTAAPGLGTGGTGEGLTGAGVGSGVVTGASVVTGAGVGVIVGAIVGVSVGVGESVTTTGTGAPGFADALTAKTVMPVIAAPAITTAAAPRAKLFMTAILLLRTSGIETFF